MANFNRFHEKTDWNSNLDHKNGPFLKKNSLFLPELRVQFKGEYYSSLISLSCGYNLMAGTIKGRVQLRKGVTVCVEVAQK